MKTFCKMLCTGIITTISVSAYADTYNKEIVLDHKDVYNSERVGFTGTYYFGEVDDSLGPLAEAAHLSPQSFVGVRITQRNREHREDGEDNRAVQGVFGTWHADSGFYLGGGTNKQSISYYPDTNDDTFSDRSYEWTTSFAGYYLNDSTDVWLGYRQFKNTSTGSDYKSTRQSLGIKHLMTLDDSHLALRAEWFNVADDDKYDEDYTELDTRVTYYPAKNIGLRFGYAKTDYKDDTSRPGWDNVVYTFGTEYFITPTLSLDMSMDRTEWSDDDSERSQKIALTTRF